MTLVSFSAMSDCAHSDRLQHLVERRADDAAGQSAAAWLFFEHLEHGLGGRLGHYGDVERLRPDIIWVHPAVNLGCAGLCVVGVGNLEVRTG